LALGEVDMTLEVVHQEGDPTGFESAVAVVEGFLEDSGMSHELANFYLNQLSLLLPVSVANDLGVGLPVGQLMEGFCEGVEPCSQPAKQLKEPGPHGVGWDA